VVCGLWFGCARCVLGCAPPCPGFPWGVGVPRRVPGCAPHIYIYIYGPYPFLLKEACQPAGFLNSLQHLRFCTEFVCSSALVHEGLVDTDGSQ
jgi:hypothetical protein